MVKTKCDKCYGTGKYNNGSNKCWKCNGSGLHSNYKQNDSSASVILKDTKTNKDYQ